MAANLAGHRQLIHDSLLDAFDDLLDERDYDRITLADVAARAGIARNTIYNYAADKAALLLAAVHRSTEGIADEVGALADATDQTAPERLTAVIEFLLTSFMRGTHRVFILQAELGSLEVEDRAIAAASIDAVQSRITRVLMDGAASGEFRAPTDIQLELVFISGVMAAAVRQMAQEPSGAATVAREATTFILRAVRAH